MDFMINIYLIHRMFVHRHTHCTSAVAGPRGTPKLQHRLLLSELSIARAILPRGTVTHSANSATQYPCTGSQSPSKPRQTMLIFTMSACRCMVVFLFCEIHGRSCSVGETIKSLLCLHLEAQEKNDPAN